MSVAMLALAYLSYTVLVEEFLPQGDERVTETSTVQSMLSTMTRPTSLEVQVTVDTDHAQLCLGYY